jgi:hypothetical protein
MREERSVSGGSEYRLSASAVLSTFDETKPRRMVSLRVDGRPEPMQGECQEKKRERDREKRRARKEAVNS